MNGLLQFIASRPTVIMFHGNGGNMGHRIPLAGIFYKRMRCNVLMMCYRGYGHSEGSPSEKGVFYDDPTSLKALNTCRSLHRRANRFGLSNIASNIQKHTNCEFRYLSLTPTLTCRRSSTVNQ